MGGPLHKIQGGVGLIRECRDWPAWFWEYFTSADDGRPAEYQMRNGSVIAGRRNRMDLRILDEIWAFKKYDYYGFRVREGDVVVDVGANIGIFAVYAATRCGAQRVVCFEPHPENFELLRRNITQNGLEDRVTCVNAAVAGTAGTGFLNVTSYNSGGHSLTGAATATTIEVPLVTLSAALAEHGVDRIDYLKLDCEGAEYSIVREASADELKRVSRISMEYHDSPDGTVDELTRKLSENGFATRLAERDRLYASRRDAG